MITAQSKYVWYKDLDRYQWFVVGVASVGWMFDTMAQQLFNLARVPALRDLMGGNASASAVSEQAGDATMVAAAGPFTLGELTSRMFSHEAEPMRYAGVAMCLVFLVGLAALPFAPETKGQPLPE